VSQVDVQLEVFALAQAQVGALPDSSLGWLAEGLGCVGRPTGRWGSIRVFRLWPFAPKGAAIAVRPYPDPLRKRGVKRKGVVPFD